MGDGLKTFRCRVRASGCTMTLDCLAPSPLAAAYAAVQQVRQEDPAPWHQVVACEWNGVLGEFVTPANAIVVAAADTPPPGSEEVIFSNVTGRRREDNA